MISNTEVTWEDYGNNIVIKDLVAEYYEQSAKFVVEYFKRTPICQYLSMTEDEEALDSLVVFIKILLSQGTSLMIFNKETKEIIGVAVVLILIFSEKAWVITQLYATHLKVRAMVNFDMSLSKNLQEERLKNNLPLDSAHVFLLCVAPQFKGYHWKPKLLKSCYRLAQSMKIPYLTYNASTMNDQSRAKYAGMKKKEQLFFGFYREPNGQYPFKNIKGEYFCISFETPVTPPIPYQELPPTEV